MRGVAECALLGLAGLVVVVDLLVRAPGHALAPPAAPVLVHEHDPVLGPFVDGAGRARGHAGRVEAVLAQPRQVEHERLFELELDPVVRLVPQLLHHGVQVTHLGGATEIVVPVGGPLDLGVLTRDEGLGPGHGEVVTRGGVDQVLVVVGPRLVVVREFRLHRGREQLREFLEPATGLELEVAAPVQFPAALPPLLVLVAARVALTGAGLHVVEPHVLGARPVGPRLLARDRTGVTTDALVQGHHHGNLGHHTHQYSTSWERLRTTDTMSRWFPVGPM